MSSTQNKQGTGGSWKRGSSFSSCSSRASLFLERSFSSSRVSSEGRWCARRKSMNVQGEIKECAMRNQSMNVQGGWCVEGFELIGINLIRLQLNSTSVLSFHMFSRPVGWPYLVIQFLAYHRRTSNNLINLTFRLYSKFIAPSTSPFTSWYFQTLSSFTRQGLWLFLERTNVQAVTHTGMEFSNTSIPLDSGDNGVM